MSEKEPASDFIRNAVAEDIKQNRWGGQVVTRFPPEPNGYLHIGHAKAFGISFGIAEEFGGRCHLRFDDTNPTAEEQHYVDAIEQDVKWMGWDWGENIFFASDYFQQMYDYAVRLITGGFAYVDDQTPEEIRATRGSLTSSGVDSPFRNRGVEENLDLFERMKRGEFPDGSRVLRARVDMGSPNLNMRDPIMYRILHAHHHRQGDKWCVYPMYDWAHGLEDSIEGITHSLCSLEFENHRPLYDWFLDKLEVHHPQQTEFARLNMTYTVMSKRKLLSLVEGGYVTGWDDPRMPTLSGLRRAGYTPEAIREFLRRAGVNKFNSTVDVQLLEHCLRQNLNATSPRVMGVLNPLKVVITNYPGGQVEQLEAINNPEDPSAGTRKVPFTRELYIERDDFMEDAPKKFFRLTLGKEVRLRYAYFVTCTNVVKDPDGNVVELHCTYDPATRGGDSPDGRKVKGTLHWVSAEKSIPAEVRLYEHLFTKENPENVAEGEDFTVSLNPDSLKVITNARVEPSLGAAQRGDRFQFERLGYFCVDSDSTAENLVVNRTVSLKDSWAKMQKKAKS